MRIYQYLPEEALIQKAILILMKKLGPVETTRFVTIPPARKIDAVKRHRLWQSRLKKEDFFRSVFK